MCGNIIYSRTRHPGGYEWDFYTDALSFSEIYAIFIWRQGTQRFRLLVPDLQTGSRDFPAWQGTIVIAPTIVRSRKVSKPRDWYFRLSYRFEIWQAHRQRCYRSACQIADRSDNSKYKSRGFETLRDLTERRLFGYWDGAQATGRIVKSSCDIYAGNFEYYRLLSENMSEISDSHSASEKSCLTIS